jgi:predicted transcriptional regulator
LHGSRLLTTNIIGKDDRPLSCNKIIKRHFNENIVSKGGMIIDKNNVIKNAFILSAHEKSFFSIYVNSCDNSYKICE